MGGFSNWPNFDSFIVQCWGSSAPEVAGLPFGSASNIVVGTNPPYTATDFLSIYPKFGGQPLEVLNCTLVQGSTAVQLANAIPGIATGQLITGIGIAPGTVVQTYTQGQTEVTLSLAATTSASSVTLNFFVAPFVPILVINLYIALASSSLVQARWLDQWYLAMGFYVAHFLTLYLRSDGDTYSSAGQVATAGLRVGITISKAAGPVSQGLELSSGLEGWGEWQSTSYGRQLATFARIIGMGPMLLY